MRCILVRHAESTANRDFRLQGLSDFPLSEAGYRPPLRARAIPVVGKAGIALFKTAMVNLRAGERISEHDYLIGSKIAHVLCGGDVEQGSLVDEQWLLDLERAAFMELAATQKTQARIEHTLKTGKPLRN